MRNRLAFSLVLVLGVLVAGCSAEGSGDYAEETAEVVQEAEVEAPQPE